jgi:hypothetical protein
LYSRVGPVFTKESVKDISAFTWYFIDFIYPVPTAISTIVFTLFLMIFFEGKKPHHGRYNAPKAGVLGAFGFAAFSLLTLPISIITNRYSSS